MITLQGCALIAELIAGIGLAVALAGFGIIRSKSWLVGSAVAFTVLMLAATVIIDATA
ncbi:MAG: hypothetical protein WBB34_20490 [Xanthobacteraceae bacterium]